jgi:hypothetical protein
MIEATPAPAADLKPEMPVPPNLDMSKLSIANLALLVEFFDGLSYAALGFINMPKFQNTAAEDYLEPFWGHFINGLWGLAIDEIEARVPADEREAEIRAKVLLKHFADAEDFEAIEALVAPFAAKDREAA